MANHKSNIFTLFEHESLKLNSEINGNVFDEAKLKALQEFYGVKGVPYFNLIHKGVRFNDMLA